ncbi:hypothetical protein Sviol_82330 [Streptomyces violascens]|uniref:Transposase n=1 Tax=Streptomyces violascens TaxID=67381 RepID=A0ABQ3R2Q9_9ACTN|nr:hypothetical protein Sviol_82330 [Streptomyces violascens]
MSLYDTDHPAPLIEAPRKRTKKTPKSTRTNFELYGWLFMRLSGNRAGRPGPRSTC